MFELDLKLECYISNDCPFIVEDFTILKALVFDDSTGDVWPKNGNIKEYMADYGGDALFYNECMKALDNACIEYEYLDWLADRHQERLLERKAERCLR